MVAIVDPSGNIIYAPLVGFQESGQLHAYHVRLACLAMLQRNPNGFDMPELIDRIFIEPARTDVRALAKAQAKNSRKRTFTRKSRFGTSPRSRRGALTQRTARPMRLSLFAQGGLVRTGTINNIEFREPANFTIELLFIQKPQPHRQRHAASRRPKLQIQ